MRPSEHYLTDTKLNAFCQLGSDSTLKSYGGFGVHLWLNRTQDWWWKIIAATDAEVAQVALFPPTVVKEKTLIHSESLAWILITSDREMLLDFKTFPVRLHYAQAAHVRPQEMKCSQAINVAYQTASCIVAWCGFPVNFVQIEYGLKNLMEMNENEILLNRPLLSC